MTGCAQFGLSWKSCWDNDFGSHGRTYELEPPIHTISKFELEPSDDNVVCFLSDSRKQFLTHEAEMLRIRQFSTRGQGGEIATMNQLQANATQKVKSKGDLDPKPITEDPVPTKAHVSIMGYVKRTSSGAIKQPSRLTNTVKYKFKEGFSAAVRRKVYYQDFF